MSRRLSSRCFGLCLLWIGLQVSCSPDTRELDILTQEFRQGLAQLPGPGRRPGPAERWIEAESSSFYLKALRSPCVAPETWKKGPYTRTGGPPNVSIMAGRGDKAAQAEMAAVREKYGLPEKPHTLHKAAPRALGAQLDVVGGWDRVADPENVRLPDELAVNLCTEQDLGEEGWRSVNAPGWHKVRLIPTHMIHAGS